MKIAELFENLGIDYEDTTGAAQEEATESFARGVTAFAERLKERGDHLKIVFTDKHPGKLTIEVTDK